ncbi:hypothetical protein ACXU4B_14565 [Dyella soli]|uniref:SbsA Ig-like domain-containing protein n=1 Tax=Dyella soli TaxID=522319 RepID=A0A4R0YRC5_9GAMM|nr:hypothetical protein [Dyella soli]TCI09130.1 hypothetical protein EZM97_23110 [Dyella soli]
MRWRPLLIGVALAAMLQVAWGGEPAPQVVLVQPSGAEVPANILRLSVVFAAPIEGAVLPRIALAHADGRPVPDPFLPQELWSPDAKVLTLLLHPGRVKTGLVAREQWGPVAMEGDDMVLTFDGHPIKRWHIGPVDTSGPVASAWKLSPVSPGSRQPLVVTLDGPIDGRDVDYLAVVDAHDRRVDGTARLREGESMWTFMPDTAWRPGKYRLVMRGTLEDPSGNRLGGHFETPMGSPQPTPTDTAIAFKVGPDSSL